MKFEIIEMDDLDPEDPEIVKKVNKYVQEYLDEMKLDHESGDKNV